MTLGGFGWTVVWMLTCLGLSGSLASGICAVRHRIDEGSYIWTYVFVWLAMLGCILWFTT